MTSIECVTLEVADPTAADRFYTAAFGLGTQVRLRAPDPDGFAWEATRPSH
jgi:catechol 2,3-dioxygenase-like lactoylglutathione lyase family enzyme